MGFLPKQITNYEEFDFIQVMAIEDFFFLPEILYNVVYKEETHVSIPLFSINRYNCCSTHILRTTTTKSWVWWFMPVTAALEGF